MARRICGLTVSQIALFLVLVLHTATMATGAEGDLKRRAYFGARVKAVTDEARQAQKLNAPGGALIEQLMPNSTAAETDFRVGDVVVAVDGAAVSDATAFVRLIGAMNAGQAVTLDFVRDGSRRTSKVAMKEWPRETSADLEVSYGTVTSRAGRLRTLVTRPKGPGKFPALLLIQGLGLFSVDNPIGVLESYKTIAHDFSRHGFVTVRVDKPGCGDSEGGPARDVDFETELDGYQQALTMLKGMPSVDPERVLIFGHSMGGVMAPLLARESPVKGIAVYGTVAETWHEYMLANLRRQMELANDNGGEINQTMRIEAALMHYLYNENMKPSDVAARHPELALRIKQLITDDNYFVGRSMQFFRQLYAKNLGEAWQRVDSHVLAIWGKADFVSTERDHALIARLVNREHPDKAIFLAMDGIDHGFNKADSQLASFQQKGTGDFNPEIITTLRDWATKTVGSSPARP